MDWKHTGIEKHPLIEARKCQVTSINKFVWCAKKRDVYFYLYLEYLDNTVNFIAFQNDSFETKLGCEKGAICIYNLCKDREYLKKIDIFTRIIELPISPPPLTYNTSRTIFSH